MTTPLPIALDPEQLKPLLERVADEAIARYVAAQAQLNSKLAYSEGEAARLLGLKPHQLRDARRADTIECSQITGRRIRYTQEDLLEYLRQNRWEPGR
jgi:hypothetical protein